MLLGAHPRGQFWEFFRTSLIFTKFGQKDPTHLLLIHLSSLCANYHIISCIKQIMLASTTRSFPVSSKSCLQVLPGRFPYQANHVWVYYHIFSDIKQIMCKLVFLCWNVILHSSKKAVFLDSGRRVLSSCSCFRRILVFKLSNRDSYFLTISRLKRFLWDFYFGGFFLSNMIFAPKMPAFLRKLFCMKKSSIKKLCVTVFKNNRKCLI